MTKHKPLPPQAELLAAFDYDPSTGVLTRKSTGRPVGTKITSVFNGQPMSMTVKHKRSIYKVHRLIWVLMTGDDPGAATIDHKNNNPWDNTWSNLRLANPSLQSFNRRPYGVSGHKGIYFVREGRWMITKRIDGKRRTIGYEQTMEAAVQALAKAGGYS